MSIRSFEAFLSLENSEEIKANPIPDRTIFSKLLEGEECFSEDEGI